VTTVLEATRSTLFDLHSRIGLNIGVLLVWWAVSTVIFPFASLFMKWKVDRAKKQMAAENERK
jgi:hypothetical protein